MVEREALYGVTTSALNQAVRRNGDRFPADFMFRLDAQEWVALRLQIVTSNAMQHDKLAQSAPLGSNLRSQTVISSFWGGVRYPPNAFTEQGVAMLSSVLRSKRAIDVNIAIMRTFVQLRRLMDSNRDLARKIEAMELKYDEQFAVVFDAIKKLIADDPSRKAQPKRSIGFTP